MSARTVNEKFWQFKSCPVQRPNKNGNVLTNENVIDIIWYDKMTELLKKKITIKYFNKGSIACKIIYRSSLIRYNWINVKIKIIYLY